MIPTLFYPNTNTNEMDSNGIGRLTDCIYCRCTEERNGIYELEFQYPVNGVYFDQILIGRIVCAVPSEGEGRQPFIIYRRTASLGGTAIFNAYHYSYMLTYVITREDTPGTTYNLTAADAMNRMWNAKYNEFQLTQAFTFYSDKTNKADWRVDVPSSIKSMLYGQQGSILDVYGTGEFYYDKRDVYFYASRGQDNGVIIQYGKNLTKLEDTLDGSLLYGGVLPYWIDPETQEVSAGFPVYGWGEEEDYWTDEGDPTDPDHWITDENETPILFRNHPYTLYPLDLSDQFATDPGWMPMHDAAVAYLNASTPWIPKRNIKVDFVALWQTEEYSGIAGLERVKLCDTVRVIYPELNVVATAKVIKTVWNVLLDKYDSIEIGNVKDDFGGYTGVLKMDGRTFRVINGVITSVK